MEVAVHKKKISQNNKPAVRLLPPWFLEWGFYGSVAYGLIGVALGVQIDRLGILILAGLGGLCLLGFRERAVDVFRTLVFPIGLGISYLIIQMMFHGLSLQQEYVKMFIPWILTLIIVQALSFRKGFFHRFVIFALLVGGVMLFFIDMKEYGTEGVTRLGLDKGSGIGLSNSNSLADWFGFCAVYMYMYGVVAGRQKTRIVAWSIATGCLLIVTLTVSRGALLSCLLAIVLGSREFLKRGFFPVLLLILLALIVYGTGIFDQAVSFYTMRATEESGRSLAWPRAVESFINSPLTGVGANKVYIFLPEKAKIITPHNSFLFIAMASGIIPLVFYSGYWIQAGWSAFRAPMGKDKAAPFYLPLVAYAFLICQFSNVPFMVSWVIVTLAAALTSPVLNRQAPQKVIPGKKEKTSGLR